MNLMLKNSFQCSLSIASRAETNNIEYSVFVC